MKPIMHTREWLCWTRERAGLSRRELAEHSDVSFGTVASVETGARIASPEMWAKLDKVLYALVPAAYVDEKTLVEYARKRGKRSEGRAKCRLYYVVGGHGVVFTHLLPENDDSRQGPHIVVTWAEAEALLEAQKSAFE